MKGQVLYHHLKGGAAIWRWPAMTIIDTKREPCGYIAFIQRFKTIDIISPYPEYFFSGDYGARG